MHDQVSQALDEGQVNVAIKLQNRLMAAIPPPTGNKRFIPSVQALLKNKDYEQALPMMEKHIDMFEQSRFQCRWPWSRFGSTNVNLKRP